MDSPPPGPTKSTERENDGPTIHEYWDRHAAEKTVDRDTHRDMEDRYHTDLDYFLGRTHLTVPVQPPGRDTERFDTGDHIEVFTNGAWHAGRVESVTRRSSGFYAYEIRQYADPDAGPDAVFYAYPNEVRAYTNPWIVRGAGSGGGRRASRARSF